MNMKSSLLGNIRGLQQSKWMMPALKVLALVVVALSTTACPHH